MRKPLRGDRFGPPPVPVGDAGRKGPEGSRVFADADIRIANKILGKATLLEGFSVNDLPAAMIHKRSRQFRSIG